MDNIELPTYEELASQQAKLLDENMMQENHIKELEQQNAELVYGYREIQTQRDQLQSLVFNLKNAIAYSLDYLHVNGEMTTIGYNSKCHKELLDADKQTPQQSLANIQADAIEGLKESIKWFGYNKSIATQIEEYINQLREQSKNA
jgi:hypothetical protein